MPFPAIPDGCGPVALLSSNEFLSSADPFDRAMLDVSRGTRIALLCAAAGADAPNAARHGTGHYRRFGADPTDLGVAQRDHATAGALGEFDILFLCGGSPSLLRDVLRDTPLWDQALARWRAGATLAGSSAGAMMLCADAQTPRPGDRMPTAWGRGLGPLSGVALAVHADERPKEWLQASAASAPCPLIAMDNNTGVILRPGEPPLIAGPGRIRVVDRP